LRESSINLKIIQKRKYLNDNELFKVQKENTELIAIFTTSIQTAKNRQKSDKL
jgi:hypothetical protein